jgi:hypothetical protein
VNVLAIGQGTSAAKALERRRAAATALAGLPR